MKRSKVHPAYKTKYKARNWPAYDRALVRRGDFTLWLSPTALRAWSAVRSGKPDGQRRYSDVAIEAALMLGLVFRQPWRQTEGILNSLLWQEVYDAASRVSAKVVIPPRKDAVPSRAPNHGSRNKHIAHRKRVGKRQWRVDTISRRE
ncbi:MAG: hypothetical protein ACI9MC_002677 [Kiritimatiellia bacterium]|jgi:hypothetical protein